MRYWEIYRFRAGCSGTSGAGRLLGFAVGLVVALFGVGIVSDTAGAVPRKVKRECKRDYKTLCPRYKVGTSRMRSCMRSKGRQLSWGCYEALRDHGYVRRGSSKSRRRRR